jgi:hypothetical protein
VLNLYGVDSKYHKADLMAPACNVSFKHAVAGVIWSLLVQQDNIYLSTTFISAVLCVSSSFSIA